MKKVSCLFMGVIHGVDLFACNNVVYSKLIGAAVQLTYYGDDDLKFAVPEEY